MSLAVGRGRAAVKAEQTTEDEDDAILSLAPWSTTPIFLLEIAPLSLFDEKKSNLDGEPCGLCVAFRFY